MNILVVLLGLAGGWIWSRSAGELRGPDGLAVLSLVGGPGGWGGVATVAAWGAAAGVLSLGVARWVGARRGMLVAAIAGFVLALGGGPIDGLLRYEAGDGLYLRMMSELALVQAVAVAWLSVLEICQPAGLKDRWGGSVWRGRAAVGLPGGVLTGAIAAVAGQVLIRDSATPQVMVGLLVGFVAAGVVVRAGFGRWGVRGAMILGPMLLGLGAYGVMGWRYDDEQALLRAWHAGRLSGLGLMLPGQIVAAGWLGVLLGERIGRRMGTSAHHAGGEAPGGRGGFEK
ncbi:MAG: hypothetical protein IT442_10070 [Phycisphaeraceae bacterium]|nr:hypothetical protein [Phycisphaeraceae bacterium]